MDRKEHWENVHTGGEPADASWHQDDPKLSLELIGPASPDRGAVIDIGGGASLLVDRLLDAGFTAVAVLDIAAAALSRAKDRLGARADRVRWIVADVTAAGDLGRFDIWHDRAVFHFLTDPPDRRKYVELATRTVPHGGHLILGAFALEGPPKCSGLEVRRYDAGLLASELGPAFGLVKAVAQTHTTPRGATQQFVYGLFERI